MDKNIRINTTADLDINQHNDMIICNVQPGNNRTRVLKFNITDFGMDLTFPAGTFAQMTWVKPDNTVIIEDSKTKNSNITMEKITTIDAISSDTISSTIVTYILSANATAVPGICKFKIDFLLNADDGKGGETIESLSTVSGKVRVDKEIVNNKTIISTDEYKSAESIIGEGRKVIDDCNTTIDNCNKATNESNTATDNCKKATSDCKAATINCKTATDKCNTATQILQNSIVGKPRTEYSSLGFKNIPAEKNLIGTAYFEFGKFGSGETYEENLLFDLGKNHIQLYVGFKRYEDDVDAHGRDSIIDDDNYLEVSESLPPDFRHSFLNITDPNNVKITLIHRHWSDGEIDFEDIEETIVCSLAGFDGYDFNVNDSVVFTDDFGTLYKHLGKYYLAKKDYPVPKNNIYCTKQNMLGLHIYNDRITSFNMSKKDYMPIMTVSNLKDLSPIYFDTSKKVTIELWKTVVEDELGISITEKKIATITATPRSFDKPIITDAKDLKKKATIYKVNGSYILDGSGEIPIYTETDYADEIENVTFKSGNKAVISNIKQNGTIDISDLNADAVKTINGISPDTNGNVDVDAVKTVNGIFPDTNGNVNVDAVKTVNGISPDTNGNVNVSTYGESIEVSRTCFEITPDMVDVSKTYTDYNDLNNYESSIYPTFYLYLNDNYIINRNKEYLYFNFDANELLNIVEEETPHFNYTGYLDINIYNADGSWLVDTTITMETNSTLNGGTNSAYDCLSYANYVYFYYRNFSWNADFSGQTVETLTYPTSSKKGYLYIPTDNKAINKILAGEEFVKTVNGISPNENGNVTIGASSSDNAVTHTASTAVGSENKGVYVNADGAAMPMKYSVNKDVPSNAVFTDTTYDIATTTTAGLMSSSDKNKLDGLAANTNKYVHPSYTAKSSGLYKITVDETGHVSNTSTVNQSDITALGIATQDHSHNYAASTTPGGPATSLSYKHVNDIKISGNDITVYYSDGTSQTSTIKTTSAPKTGKITNMTSNSTSYGYVTLNAPLEANTSYDIDNGWKYSGIIYNIDSDGNGDVAKQTGSPAFGDVENIVVTDSTGTTKTVPVINYNGNGVGAYEEYSLYYTGSSFSISGNNKL